MPEDRNSSSANWRGLLRFSELISDLGLIDLHLEGHQFTWSNARQDTAMARLDHFLVSTEWNVQFPNSTQKAYQTHRRTIAQYCTQQGRHSGKQDFFILKIVG